MSSLVVHAQQTAPKCQWRTVVLVTKEEVNMMSATTAGRTGLRANSAPVVRRARPHGLDRAVMRLSLAMLLWARKRSDRAAITPEQHRAQRDVAEGIARRQHESALLAARVR